jgi:hypothetical protein
MRLRNFTTGEVIEGRCRATNLCPYCRIMGVVETAEMLWLDAAEYAPTLWIVLTSREHLQRRDTYLHLKKLRQACRRRWPAIEWFVQVEFQRRGALHLNLLVKGVDTGDGDRLLALVSDVWCRRVDALPVGQHIEVLGTAQAVVKYLQKELTHGLKAEQAPPIGWKGHRTSQTRGYLVRPASVMREEAKASLRRKRAIWRALQQGLSGPAAEAAVDQELAERSNDEWKLWQMPGVTEHRPKTEHAGAGPVRVKLRQEHESAIEAAIVSELAGVLVDDVTPRSGSSLRKSTDQVSRGVMTPPAVGQNGELTPYAETCCAVAPGDT